MKLKKVLVILIPIGFIGMLIIPPFIVSLVFKITPCNNLFSAEWTPDGYLAYLGAIFGAFATIGAVLLSINNERKQLKEDRILSAQPWLTSDTELLCSNEDIIKESKGTTVFVELNDGVFGSSSIVPYSIQDGSHKINQKDCVIKYILENAGGNNATKIKMTINDYPLFPDFAMIKDHNKEIIFILPIRQGEKESRYVLKYKYGDVVSNTIYVQTETLIIKMEEYGTTFVQSQKDLLTEPKKENNDG